MISALSASFLLGKSGKWNLLMVTNVIAIVGSVLTLYDNMKVICVGKFIFGLAMGGYSVYCPNFLNETVPLEWKGPIWTITNSMVAVGILIPSLFGLYFPENMNQTHTATFQVQHYWRVIWAFPILIACLQMSMLCCCFRFDTPVELKKRGEMEKLRVVLGKLYGED